MKQLAVRLGVALDEEFTLHADASIGTLESPFPCPCTVQHALTNYLDINGSVSKTLLRRLGQLEPAQAAIETAARLAPTSPDIGLEAGVIAVLGGRDEAARQSWQSVIDLQPESLAAGTAKSYLEQLGPAAPVTQEEPPA